MLTPKQEAYVQNLVSGMSQREAYRAAYPSSLKWKDKSVDNKASALLNKNGEILARYNELKERSANKAVLTRARKKELLRSIAESEEAAVSDRLKAIDLDNKMEGDYAATKVEANVGTSSKLADVIGQLTKEGGECLGE